MKLVHISFLCLGVFNFLFAAEVVHFQQYTCPYRDSSEVVNDLKGDTIKRIDDVVRNVEGCNPEMVAKANLIGNEVSKFVREQKRRLRTKKNEDEFGPRDVDCANYFGIYQYEYDRAFSSIKQNRPIPENNYFAFVCGDESGKEYIECLENKMVERLVLKKESCSTEDGQTLMQFSQEQALAIDAQMETFNKIQESMSSLYEGLKSQKCMAQMGLRQAAIKNLTAIGSSLASHSLSPYAATMGMGIALSGTVINYVFDYISRWKKKGTIFEDLKDNTEFEDHMCLFFDIQKKGCAQYDREIPLPPPSCSGEELEGVEANATIQLARTWEKNIDNWVQTIEYSKDIEGRRIFRIIAEDFLKQYNSPELEFPTSDDPEGKEKKSFRQLLDLGIEYYRSNGLQRNGYILEKALEGLENFERLEQSIVDYDRVKASMAHEDDRKKRKALQEEEGEILKEIEQYIQSISHLKFSKLLERYLREKKGLEDLQVLEIREMVSKMTKANAKKSLSRVGDPSLLVNLTTSMVDTFKPLVDKFMRSRRVNALLAARKSEEKDIAREQHGELDSEDRKHTFRQLRDIIKDCLVLSSINYMRHETRGSVESRIKGIQVPAPFNIKLDPQNYLNVCSPFMCKYSKDEPKPGIPIPFLPNEATRDDDYGRYQCHLIFNHDQIYQKMEEEYIKSGKICGRTIYEIAKNTRVERTLSDHEYRKPVVLQSSGESSAPHEELRAQYFKRYDK